MSVAGRKLVGLGSGILKAVLPAWGRERIGRGRILLSLTLLSTMETLSSAGMWDVGATRKLDTQG